MLGDVENSELSRRPWDLEKFKALPLHIGFGNWENFDLSSSSSKYSLLAKNSEARCELSLF